MNILETHMKVCSTAVFSALVLLSHGSAVQAQEQPKTKKPGAKRRVLKVAAVQSIRRDPVYVVFSYVGASVTETGSGAGSPRL